MLVSSVMSGAASHNAALLIQLVYYQLQLVLFCVKLNFIEVLGLPNHVRILRFFKEECPE